MPIEAGGAHVFDLGYYDFAFWARLDALGCRLVTRFKTNAPRDLTLEPGTTVLSDRIGFLPARQAMNRKNPMQDAMREIVVKTETGETLRLLTNDLDAKAQEIADLDKRRWRIELFFRVMKQTLRITKFVGRSENAGRIQIAVALIACLLLRALQKISEETRGFLERVRLVRANLMHIKDPTRLRSPQPPPLFDPRQLQLTLAPT
jgi:IS4 transposase